MGQLFHLVCPSPGHEEGLRELEVRGHDEGPRQLGVFPILRGDDLRGDPSKSIRSMELSIKHYSSKYDRLGSDWRQGDDRRGVRIRWEPSPGHLRVLRGSSRSAMQGKAHMDHEIRHNHAILYIPIMRTIPGICCMTISVETIWDGLGSLDMRDRDQSIRPWHIIAAAAFLGSVNIVLYTEGREV